MRGIWALLGALLAGCARPAPAPRRPLGEPVPSASTSATPQWLRNTP